MTLALEEYYTPPDGVHVGAGAEETGGRIAPFNPAGGRQNCAAAVAAFLKTMKTRILVTAEDIESQMGTKLGPNDDVLPPSKALGFVEEAAGVTLSGRPATFGGPFADSLAAGDYVLLAQEHIMIGRVVGGRRIIYDVQNQRFLSWTDAIKLYGVIGAYRVF